MKLTKYEHACFTLEKDDQILVVDPGGWTSDFISPDNVIAIVITHEHADHLDHDQITAIIDKNQDAVIIAHPDIASKIEVFETQSVKAGDNLSIGPFELEFFGGEHAQVLDSIPIIPNLGVLINELVYYPGDSFTLPNKSVDVLSLPVGAPWLKLNKTVNFLTSIKPRLAFPTHDAVLSEIGKSLSDSMIKTIADTIGVEYTRLTAPIEI